MLGMIVTLVLVSCKGEVLQADPTAKPSGAAISPATIGTGTLIIEANGEDFVRQGLITKDGWNLKFDHVYVTLGEVKAYQTEPPFDPTQSEPLQAMTTVESDQTITVDLAAGDASAEPIKVAELEAPAGRYNALSWTMVKAPTGPAQGYPMVLIGTATKSGQTLDFTIKLAETFAFACGSFVGDERKGILNPGSSAEVEATFHFDHLFGDADTAAEDALNTGSLGFEPLASLTQTGQLEVDSKTLKANLSLANLQKLKEILPSLGHVGEGHCQATQLTP
jgi:hypothetical protein